LQYGPVLVAKGASRALRDPVLLHQRAALVDAGEQDVRGPFGRYPRKDAIMA
jgi:hypothetical protein